MRSVEDEKVRATVVSGSLVARLEWMRDLKSGRGRQISIFECVAFQDEKLGDYAGSRCKYR